MTHLRKTMLIDWITSSAPLDRVDLARGIAKPLGAIALLVTGMVRIKEWAYAGFAIAWICSFFAHYLAGDKPFGPLVLLALLVVSYLTCPAIRQYPATVTQN